MPGTPSLHRSEPIQLSIARELDALDERRPFRARGRSAILDDRQTVTTGHMACDFATRAYVVLSHPRDTIVATQSLGRYVDQLDMFFAERSTVTIVPPDNGNRRKVKPLIPDVRCAARTTAVLSFKRLLPIDVNGTNCSFAHIAMDATGIGHLTSEMKFQRACFSTSMG